MKPCNIVRSIRSRECPDIEIKVASTREERLGAFRLAYNSYLRAGLCRPCELRVRITPFQLVPSTDIVIAELRGEIISTLSLVRDGELGLPMESVYGREVQQRRHQGVRLAEVSCLADRRLGTARFFGLFCELARVIVQMADRDGIDHLLIAVHPRHARMYSRAMAFAKFGDSRGYPAVNGNPAVALCLDLGDAKKRMSVRWQKFTGDLLPDEVISRRPISAVDSRFFERLLRQSELLQRDEDPPLSLRSGSHAALPLVCA
jgi:hypothetical protein